MKRKDFIRHCGSCGVLSLITFALPDTPSCAQKNDEKNFVHDVNRRQITKLLSYIDNETDKTTKQNIFNKLGYECIHSSDIEKWIQGHTIESLLEYVNSGKSRYWERLEYHPEKSTLQVIGRNLQACTCAYGQSPQPTESLCRYCCKSFQQELFGMVFQKKVDVVINESFLLGGERCCAIITIA